MNHRGQAMLEALLTSAVWSLGFLFLLKAALNLGTQMLVDDWTDEFLLCRNEFCEQRLVAQLKQFGMADFQAARTAPHQLAFRGKSQLLGDISIRKEISLASAQK